MKGAKIIFGIAVVAAAAILSPPLMTRFWDERQLTLASTAILAHGLMGTLDFFKPVIIRRVAVNPSFATLYNLLAPSLASSVVMSAGILAVGLLYLSEIYHYLIASIAISVIFYGIYSPFWGLLNASLRMSDTYLIRSSSVAFLYGALGLGALTGRDEVIYASLILANLFPVLIFLWQGRKLLCENRWNIDSSYWAEVGNVVVQNAARCVNDFGDRIAATILLPISVGGKYIIASDISSRANVFTQLITVQYYPILCKHTERSGLFLIWGISLSLLVILTSIAALFFGYEIFIWYLGNKMGEVFWVFCCLLASFGVHTLGYFGQAVLRSQCMDKSLSLSLIIPACMCILYIIMSSSFDLKSIVVLVIISKSSSFFMMVGLMKNYKVQAIGGMACCVLSWAFVSFVIMDASGYLGGAVL